MMLRIVVAVVLSALLARISFADDAVLAVGKALATVNCTTCHAIGPTGASPMREAPPFRDIAANYDGAELEDALNEGVATDHPAMPDWQMTPEQAAALSAYIMSLAPHGVRKTELQ